MECLFLLYIYNTQFRNDYSHIPFSVLKTQQESLSMIGSAVSSTPSMIPLLRKSYIRVPGTLRLPLVPAPGTADSSSRPAMCPSSYNACVSLECAAFKPSFLLDPRKSISHTCRHPHQKSRHRQSHGLCVRRWHSRPRRPKRIGDEMPF